MPVGNYPIWKDKKQTIKHPASGLSKNKYDAKGNLRPQRKSRAKAEKPEGQIKDRTTGEMRDRIRAERSDIGSTNEFKQSMKMAEIASKVTTKLAPIAYEQETAWSMDGDSDEDIQRGSKTYKGYEGRFKEDPNEELKLIPHDTPKSHQPDNPYPHLFGTYDEDDEWVSNIGGFATIEGEEEGSDRYALQRNIADKFIKNQAFGDSDIAHMLRRHPTFNVKFTDNNTPYFYDPNANVLPSTMKHMIKLKDGRRITATQHREELEFIKNVKGNYVAPHSDEVDNVETNTHREQRITHWGKEYGRGLYRERVNWSVDNVDSEGRPRLLYKGGYGASLGAGKYRSQNKFIHYGKVPPASIDPPFIGMNKQDIVDINGNPLYQQENGPYDLVKGKNKRYIRLMAYADDYEEDKHNWIRQNATGDYDN